MMETVFNMPDLGPVMPEIVFLTATLIIMMLDLVIARKETLAFLSFIVAGATGYLVLNTRGITFNGMFVADGYGMFFKLIFMINLMLTILISIKYIKDEKVNFGEYYSLMLFSTLGMMIMASAGDLIVLYLGLELMALSTYVLAGFTRHKIRSNEAALKYFLLGAFASAFLLFGISLTYGLTGTTDINAVASYIAQEGLVGNPMLSLALAMFTVAFGFKIAASPFHMWAPDVYEGAPTSVTAFMSVGPKAAGFAALGKVFLIAFIQAKVNWSYLLIPVAILTMATGNILALAQTNIKRMLAYSSIAHAGYALIGIITGGPDGISSVMNYLFIYAFMNIGAFSIVILLRKDGVSCEDITDFKGLAKTHPFWSALMLVFMFSLTGIPPTAGFIGKFYLFMGAINAGYTWLVLIAVMFSAISAYFYLRIVMYMYMHEPKEGVELNASPAINLAAVITFSAVLLIGVLPAKILDLARTAVSGF